MPKLNEATNNFGYPENVEVVQLEGAAVAAPTKEETISRYVAQLVAQGFEQAGAEKFAADLYIAVYGQVE